MDDEQIKLNLISNYWTTYNKLLGHDSDYIKTGIQFAIQ